MSCKFCEEKKTIHSDKVGQGIRTMRTNLSLLFGADLIGAEETDDKKIDGVFFDKDCTMGFDNSSGEYASQYVSINYCPFCGKKVRD